ncbi:hypothetical protein [Oleiagrimonas soli]|uniref:Uncharacterized protein n=1 Tax=Oleiagrimonas soli TaxID=1543381 RepID=A0A099CX16_9GAMM|nr:hypothetical protein [Oleiagrimonas soli]KGI77515.1 hypothetical protein LF63_0109260 [Oleiagrimonas soli]MBB6183017.1 hypothetical protein [Oleiagrimonas soli]
MRFDIRIAALSQAFEQRLRIAASLLGAYKINMQVDAWNGTRCHLLIAAGDDLYGQKALDIAHRRGTAVLAVGAAVNDAEYPVIGRDAAAVDIARRMRELLKPTTFAPTAKPDDAATALHALFDGAWRHRPVDVLLDRRVVYLRPQTGRIFAATHSDLLAIQQALAEDSGELGLRAPEALPEHAISSSLEAYLLHIAHAANEKLPPYPDGRYHLKAWPDLGSVPALRDAMAVVARLTQGPTSPSELETALNGSPAASLIRPSLWAFSAAGLLQADAVAPQTAPRPVADARKQGIWASIARHFGLKR